MMKEKYDTADFYVLQEKKLRENMQINMNNTAYSKLMYILSLIEDYRGNHEKQ